MMSIAHCFVRDGVPLRPLSPRAGVARGRGQDARVRERQREEPARREHLREGLRQLPADEELAAA